MVVFRFSSRFSGFVLFRSVSRIFGPGNVGLEFRLAKQREIGTGEEATESAFGKTVRTTATQTSRGSACDVETFGHGHREARHEHRDVVQVVFRLLDPALKSEVPASVLLGAFCPPFFHSRLCHLREGGEYDIDSCRRWRRHWLHVIFFWGLRGRAEVGSPTFARRRLPLHLGQESVTFDLRCTVAMGTPVWRTMVGNVRSSRSEANVADLYHREVFILMDYWFVLGGVPACGQFGQSDNLRRQQFEPHVSAARRLAIIVFRTARVALTFQKGPAQICRLRAPVANSNILIKLCDGHRSLPLHRRRAPTLPLDVLDLHRLLQELARARR